MAAFDYLVRMSTVANVFVCLDDGGDSDNVEGKKSTQVSDHQNSVLFLQPPPPSSPPARAYTKLPRQVLLQMNFSFPSKKSHQR